MEDDQELGLAVRDLLLLFVFISEGVEAKEGAAVGGVGAGPSSGVVRPEGGLLLLMEDDDEDGLGGLMGSVGGGVGDDDEDVGSGCCGGSDCCSCCCNSSSGGSQRPEGGIKALES